MLAPAALALPGAVEASVPRDGARRLAEAYGVATLEGFGSFTAGEAAAAAMALDYVRATQKGEAGRALPHLSRPVPRGGRGVLQMDAATRRSLEILRSERGGAGDCLLGRRGPHRDRGRRPVAGRPARLPAGRAGADRRAARCGRRPARRRAAAGAHPRHAEGRAGHGPGAGRLALDRFAPRDLAAIRDGLGRAATIAAALERPEGLTAIPPLLAERARALRPARGPGARAGRALAETCRPGWTTRASSRPAMTASSTGCAGCGTMPAAPSPRCSSTSPRPGASRR